MRKTLRYGDVIEYRSKLSGNQPVRGVIVKISFPFHASGCWEVGAYSEELSIVSLLPAFGSFTVIETPDESTRRANVARCIEHTRKDYGQYPVWAEQVANPDYPWFECQWNDKYWAE